MRKKYNTVLQNLSNDKVYTDSTCITTTNLIKNILINSSEIKGQVVVIKLPSSIIEDDNLLSNFTENIKLISTCGAKVFIVHDHTNLVQDTLNLLGFDQKLINNLTVVDHKSAQIIEMVLSGYINKLIVSRLCNTGCIAVGISGKDGNLIHAKRSKSLHKVMGSKVIDIGFISTPIIVNPEIILSFEESNIIPVISPIASDINGNTHLLDVNATASVVSSALDADHLVFLGDGKMFGESYWKVSDIQTLQKLKSSVDNNDKVMSIIDASIASIENSANLIHFVNAQTPDSILLSIFT